MKIQKLKLCNFSSYEGENQFEFMTGKKKTVVLIGGQNGAGKTSLFTAIKVALYGPLAFGYTGMNAYYVKRIKDLINKKAFQNDVLHSYVSIVVAVKRERDICYYEVTRRWYTDENKIAEEYSITENGRLLDETERNYFENYLYDTLPPKLFEFFLFDGEEVGNIFATEGYHNYVREALLTLCGMDMFSTIKRFCGSFVDKKASDESKQLTDAYKKAQKKIDKLQLQIQKDQDRQAQCTSDIESLQSEIEAIQSKFEKIGGISDAQLRKLRAKELEKDKKRTEISAEIKSFMENEMPFYIVRDMMKPMEKQLEREEKLAIYEYVSNIVTQDFLGDFLETHCDDPVTLSEELYQAILQKLGPDSGSVEQEAILDLSRDEVSRIDHIMDQVRKIEPVVFIERIRIKNRYTDDILAIHQKLRETLTEEDARKYKMKKETAEAKVQGLHAEMETLTVRIAAMEEDLKRTQEESAGIYQQIMESAQNQHIYELSSGISNVMQKLIEQKTDSIRHRLAEYTLHNLNEIYRKDNLISRIEIEDNFKFHLYQAQDFTLQELQSLLSNVGSKEFLELIGVESVEQLQTHFQVYDASEMVDALKAAYSFDGVFHLYQRIDLGRLSKGERQIFILALYWAMIQISEKEIPFIIDTPYARIDANHREEISRKFFPNISGQVIILSTDEEITEEYYRILKKHIAKEYLLSNQQDDNRTTIENRYFFEV